MKAKEWLKSAVLVLAGWWIYYPALHGGWVWDDRTDITENAVLRDPAGWWKIWLAPQSLDYYPLKTGVQWVQWRLWGLDSFGYHLTNLSLHLLSGFLIWQVLRKLGVRLAWLGGLLFVVHPLAVESVAWVVELKNTLSLPLLLGAMTYYLEYDERSRWSALSPTRLLEAGAEPTRWGQRVPPYLASLFLFVAAMLSKTSAVMFPAVLLLYAWWRRGRIDRKDLKASAPFFAVSLALGLATIWLQQHRTIGAAVVPMGGFLSRLAGAGVSAAFYFEKFVIPVGLSPVYGRWAVDPPALWQFWPWVPVGGVGWAFIYFRSGLTQRVQGAKADKPTFGPQKIDPASRDRSFVTWWEDGFWVRHLVFGLGFFLLNLLPVLGFVRVSFMRFTSVMDHLAYLPMVGLVGLAAAAAGGAEKFSALPLSRFSAFNRLLFWISAAVIIAGLAVASRRHAMIFRNEEALWNRAVEVRPEAWPAHNNLGIALESSGRFPEAIAQYGEALRIEPANAESHFNLGIAFGRERRLDDAIGQYEIAIKLQPNFLRAYFNLAEALASAGRWPEAIIRYQEALRLEPRHIEAHNNLGNALNRVGRLPEAIDQFQEALRLDPGDAEAHNNLGVALA